MIIRKKVTGDWSQSTDLLELHLGYNAQVSRQDKALLV